MAGEISSSLFAKAQSDETAALMAINDAKAAAIILFIIFCSFI